MQLRLRLLVFVALIVVASATQAQEIAKIKAQLTKIETAIRQRNVAALLKLYSPDFTYTASGQTQNAQKAASNMKLVFSSIRKTNLYFIRPISIKVSGNTASVLSADEDEVIVDVAGINGRKTADLHTFRSTEQCIRTFVKKSDGWKMKSVETTKAGIYRDGQPFRFINIDTMKPAKLRTEWLENPVGVGVERPRLSWELESSERGASQSAYRIEVASSPELLKRGAADLWTSGKVLSGESLNIRYSGRPLKSGRTYYWMVTVWDEYQRTTTCQPAQWTMGLLDPSDWTASWISYRDTSPIHSDRNRLELPPARHYRKGFEAANKVKKALLHYTCLGIADFYINGNRVSPDYFGSGWSDYNQRAYVRSYDVTNLVRTGDNRIGAIVADGWYAGYVGYGLLVGYGPNRSGRNMYGKTPALLAQLDIEYENGTKSTIGTDTTWQVSGDGPIREADLIMGEAYDARQMDSNWALPESTNSLRRVPENNWTWTPACRAEENGPRPAKFFEAGTLKDVDLGFHKPPLLQSYSAPGIVETIRLPAKQMFEPKPGVYIFDFGQNFAGNVQIRLKGTDGQRIQLRYGEMRHPDGRLMTENLRRARATDYYTFRGDLYVETWTPRFTYHGFQFVEITGLTRKPELSDVTGIVIQNKTTPTSSFDCSDPTINKLAQNVKWTQRANFIEVPTDCPQRDERLGWMGDAQVYVRTATYYADVAAFFNKWIDDVRESQRNTGPSAGAYPDYAPYPMAHGAPGATHGTAWTDAGVICPWTIWKVYGDTRLISNHWQSMERFMDWRLRADPGLVGVKVGNTWGDWLNVKEETPVEYVDLCYHATSTTMMIEMATALGKPEAAAKYRKRLDALRASFVKNHLKPDGSINVETQSAYVLAIDAGLVPKDRIAAAAAKLAERIEKNGDRMATGFLGTKAILPVLTATGHHDLAVRLFQSRKFPSWGYEVEQGANTVWERWDSFTKENGYDGATGGNNAAMNSFSHYAFGAVMEWAFKSLVGIDTDGPGYHKIIIRPGVPSNATPLPGNAVPISHAGARYISPRGEIDCLWRKTDSVLTLNVVIPANTTATVYIPAKSVKSVTESGEPLATAQGVKVLGLEGDRVVVRVGGGQYVFKVGG